MSRGANLRGANLWDANLRGANLRDAGLDEVASVTYDTTTHSYTVTPSTGPTDVHITEGSLTASASGITTPTVLTAT